jgi:hypothetical protein
LRRKQLTCRIPADRLVRVAYRVPGLGGVHEFGVGGHLVPAARGQDGERDTAAIEQRTLQVTTDVLAALSKDRNCLILTNRTSHLGRFADLLGEAWQNPVIL